MNRDQLEHIVRACGGITGATEFVLIGSQAVLGQFPGARDALTQSVELDVFTWRDPLDAELIDGSIGEGSPFHKTFGYFAHGVGPETAVLPRGWKERLVPVRTPATAGATGWCVEVHDLAVSKLIAGRDKDLEWLRSLLAQKLADSARIANRLEDTDVEASVLAAARARWRRLLAERPV